LPQGHIHFDLADRSAAFGRISSALIGMKNQDRLQVLRALPSALETELPKSVPERFAPLSWKELRELASQGLDIGAHTVSHPILSELETETELYQEIAGSKASIQEATGVTVNHFCYPNGKLADVNDDAVAIAEGAGYRTAVLAESGLAGPPFSPYRLKRVGVNPDYPPLYFERCVAGYRL
jgi:peptidoglycan/xylan/chitin deacetylase (PgdA/CDA1 family)